MIKMLIQWGGIVSARYRYFILISGICLNEILICILRRKGFWHRELVLLLFLYSDNKITLDFEMIPGDGTW